jgi:Ala-tRNA(Pro) deacylase
MKRGDPNLYLLLESLRIPYNYYEHPPAPTIEIAIQYWKEMDSDHCKNLFFRNHKGNRHFLVILRHTQILDIHELEKRLKQGKITFASEQRLMKYLGVTPGSVTPFGLINDPEKQVTVFLDHRLKESERLSFHPCINTASLVIPSDGLIRFLDHCGNRYEFIHLYQDQ